MAENDELKFNVKGTIAQSEVPGWARAKRKYDELKALILGLKPGQTIIIEFEDTTSAKNAQAVVRTELNAQIGRAAIRTRYIPKKITNADGVEVDGADVYFSRLEPMDIVQSDE